LLEKYLNL